MKTIYRSVIQGSKTKISKDSKSPLLILRWSEATLPNVLKKDPTCTVKFFKIVDDKEEVVSKEVLMENMDDKTKADMAHDELHENIASEVTVKVGERTGKETLENLMRLFKTYLEFGYNNKNTRSISTGEMKILNKELFPILGRYYEAEGIALEKLLKSFYMDKELTEPMFGETYRYRALEIIEKYSGSPDIWKKYTKEGLAKLDEIAQSIKKSVESGYTWFCTKYTKVKEASMPKIETAAKWIDDTIDAGYKGTRKARAELKESKGIVENVKKTAVFAYRATADTVKLGVAWAAYVVGTAGLWIATATVSAWNWVRGLFSKKEVAGNAEPAPLSS